MTPQIGLAFLPVTIIMGTLSVPLLRAADHALRRAALLFPGLTLVAAGLALFTRPRSTATMSSTCCRSSSCSGPE